MDAGEPGNDVYLTPSEVARLLQVSPKTVSRWADKGLLPCIVTLGGHRRFRRSTVEAVQRGIYGADAEPAGDGRPD
jgi:excisionase family DNA binding protein